MKLAYFGTDGIRGAYGSGYITETFADKLSRALAAFLRDHLAQSKPNSELKIVIGRDTRFSGANLCKAFIDSFGKNGISIIDLGVIPTPQVAFAVEAFQASLGIAVTASHNPVEDNGFKLFQSNGTKFTPEQEQCIESYINLADESASTPSSDTTAQIDEKGDEIRSLYQSKLLKCFESLEFSKLKVVIDTANGATCATTPAFFREKGAEVIQIGAQPNGKNINANVGSEFPTALGERVVTEKADLGIAHDGDGDRVILVDSAGEILSGEHFMAIISQYSPTIAASPDCPLVTTVMSNFAIDSHLGQESISVIRTDVGDRNVAYEMVANGSHFGGENSGHYICSDVLKTGDGLVAVLKLLEAVQHSGKDLQTLRKDFSLFTSQLTNLKVGEKRPLETLKHLNSTIEEVTHGFNNKGRVLLRYSGTECKLRILVECESESMMAPAMEKLVNAAKIDLDVLS